MTKELQKKVDFAIKLLQSIPQDGDIELSYSGGKDSDVILELAKMAGIPYRAIYKNTTIDPPGTIAHAREVGAEVIHPKKTFFQLISERGFPSRFRRFCCSELKEYKICDRAIQGIRRSESRKRSERYKEPEMCRVYSAKEKVKVYLPILEWTDDDVAEFIKERNIKCHPLYYKDGQFDVSKRLGCVGCPLASKKKRIQEFKENPKMLKAWIRAGQKYFTSEKYQNGKAKVKFKDAYEAMGYLLYCDNMEDFKEKTYSTLLGDFDWKDLERHWLIEIISKGGIIMTEEVKKVLLEEFLPQMTCELLLHLNFFNQVIKDDKQSSELVEKAKGLLASNHMALMMLTTLAGWIGGEASIDQMMESVVDLFQVNDKEERQRMKELISGYTVMPIEKEK